MPTDDQLSLNLPAPPAADDAPLVPARMVNEYVYCPRLAYLMWVQGEWAETGDTVEGRFVHRRVDRPGPALPEPEALGEGAAIHARSVTLASQRLGLIAKIDLVEADDGQVVPVDYKRGKRPHVATGAYEPERVQVCAQGLLLEEHGYTCVEGALYYAESRERVRVPFEPALRAATLQAIHELRLSAATGRLPPPLVDSPKCPRCALVGICLPDEVGYLRNHDLAPRPIAVPADDALPLHVQAQQARIRKAGDTLEIEAEDAPKVTARLIDVSEVSVFGAVSITTPALHELMRRDIPVSFHSHGGWFLGVAAGLGARNVELRTAQYRASFDPAFCLRFARDLVQAKILNGRTLLRRNWRGDEGERDAVLRDLKRSAARAGQASGLDALLGIEGEAASVYFRAVPALLKPADDGLPPFQFERRNRRPPADPVNALLSFAYAILTRTLATALAGCGLDPLRGYYHQPRHGRPALALDLMEPFRPILADSAVLQAINGGELQPEDFVTTSAGCALTASGRRRFLGTIERRLSQETTHPLFGYRVSLRRLIQVQCRLLGRHLLGEIERYPHYLPR